MMAITRVDDLNQYHDALADLLIETVADGASIGFLAPLSFSEARSYWQNVNTHLAEPTQWMWIAFAAGQLLGTVQLSVCNKANGNHEAWASEHQLRLLVLDTKQGDTASFLYPKLGYQNGGVIPNFAKDGLGCMAATMYFYKQI